MGHAERLGKIVGKTGIGVLREIGLLVIAFTPIDAIISREATDPAKVAQIRADLGLAFKVGMGLLAASWLLEWIAGFWRGWTPKND